MITKKLFALFAVSLVLPLNVLAAEPQLASIFADHMVLQRGMKVPIWGRADVGATVAVEFAGQKKTTTADPVGKWTVEFEPLAASRESRDLVVTVGDSVVKRTDVLVGEVWLCTGQSNMEWALARSNGGPEVVANSANPLLRLCTIPHNSQLEPVDDTPAKWAVSGPSVMGSFSAIGWWMGSKLQKQLGVPVAIINAPFGGTQIQAWIALPTLQALPLPKDKSNDRDLSKADYDQRLAKAKPGMDKYLQEKAAALKAKKTPPPSPTGWPGDFRGPAVLWNGMIAPIVRFPVRGVAWYQGESNAYVGVADTYKDLLPALIRDWRGAFGQPELPFILFQLAPNRKPQADPNEKSGIAVVREAQLKTALATPHTALVVTMDLGEPDVHYKRKEPAADRGALAAMWLAYGSSIDPSGPIFDKLEIKGNQAIVHFTYTAGGLVAEGGSVKGFVVAGADHQFAFADARIDGDSVIVTSRDITAPVAVRYGWADLPTVNLFNKAGLPASPFRTDAQ